MQLTTAIAIAIRPFVVPVFVFVVVAPIAWLLYRLFPPGRLKVVLFRERTGPHASLRDKWVIGIAAAPRQRSAVTPFKPSAVPMNLEKALPASRQAVGNRTR